MNRLDEKDAAEKITVTFDFSAGLGVAETLTGTPVVTCVTYLGDDANPSAMISGVASIVGATVVQSIAGGLATVDYKLKAVCNTSAGQTLAVTAILPVR